MRDSSLVLGGMAESLEMLTRFCIAAFAHSHTPFADVGPLRPEDLSICVVPAFDGVRTDRDIIDAISGSLASHLTAANVKVQTSGTPKGFDLKALGKAYFTFSRRYFADLGLPSSADIAAAVQTRTAARAVIDGLLESHNVLICPTAATLPYPHNTEKRAISVKLSATESVEIPYWQASLSYVTPWTVTGHPVAVIPIGTVLRDDVLLPVGVQVIGKR